MADNKFCSQTGRDRICIEANRVLDACRDRDCFEDARVYLTDFGQEVIEHTGNVRVKCAKIAHTCITVDPVQFNRGFYAVNIRFYVTVRFEACVGGRNQEFDGITALEKKVILYGGECGVNTFHSGECDDICNPELSYPDSTVPAASVDVASPVVLGARIIEEREISCCHCCCCVDEIPDCACRTIGAPLTRSHCERILVVSLGIFSVVRLTRPAQYLISALEYNVPDKECVCDEDKDPCCLFRSMEFPTEEFCATSFKSGNDKHCSCGN